MAVVTHLSTAFHPFLCPVVVFKIWRERKPFSGDFFICGAWKKKKKLQHTPRSPLSEVPFSLLSALDVLHLFKHCCNFTTDSDSHALFLSRCAKSRGFVTCHTPFRRIHFSLNCCGVEIIIITITQQQLYIWCFFKHFSRHSFDAPSPCPRATPDRR